MTTQLARSAIWYAKHGWTVFPLRPCTKEPFGGLGCYMATQDVTQITAWWQRWPQANIGLHCGGCNLLAMDLDTYKDTYAGNGCLGRADEETLTSITGSGGSHLIYTVADGQRYTNSRGDLPPAIDVKCWGGYIVLPPSIHPNGNQYHWETGYRPDEIQPRPLPAKLSRILEDAWRPKRIAGPSDNFAVAMALKVAQSVLDALDIPILAIAAYAKTGRVITMQTCPFAPEGNRHADDKASFVIIEPDGYTRAGCLHERCRNRLHTERCSGWQWLIHQRTAEYRTNKETAQR